MPPTLRIEPAQESDLPRLMQLFVPAFSSVAFLSLVGFTNDAAGHALAAEKNLAAWHEQLNHSSTPLCIKCIHTDPQTGHETIVGMANWAIYERERTDEEYTRLFYPLRAHWVTDAAKRQEALSWIANSHNRRIRWFGGKPHAELYFMCVDPEFGRMGAGTLCVKWGLERCEELGIPAWLESSVVGRKMYERLGFGVVQEETGGGDRGLPMVWWPERYGEEDRKAVLPEWKGMDLV